VEDIFKTIETSAQWSGGVGRSCRSADILPHKPGESLRVMRKAFLHRRLEQ